MKYFVTSSETPLALTVAEHEYVKAKRWISTDIVEHITLTLKEDSIDIKNMSQ